MALNGNMATWKMRSESSEEALDMALEEQDLSLQRELWACFERTRPEVCGRSEFHT